MRDERDRAVGYFSRIVSGLVACSVAAVTLHAEVAAAAILVTVMVLVAAVSCAMLRGRAL
jgi:cation transport ATPase